jgi:hypothetical protein
MPLPLLIPLAAAGAAAAGSIINPILQARENRKNREYNTPVNQMARLKAGGLNPHLVYGNGANAQMPSQQAPQVDSSAPLQMLQAYQNFTLQSIEKDKIKEQIELIKLQQNSQAEVNRGRWYDTENKSLNYSLQSGLFQTNTDMQKEKLRGLGIINTGNEIKNAGNLTRNETMQLMQAPTLEKLIQDTLSVKAKRSLIPYQRDQLIAQKNNLNSSTALNDVRKLGEEKKNVILKDSQQLILQEIKVKEGIVTKNQADETLTRTRERWMSMGLSPTATSDLLDLVLPTGAIKKLSGKLTPQQNHDWERRGRERFEEIRRANQNQK